METQAKAGDLVKIKVGRNIVEAEVLEVIDGAYKVRSSTSGKEFTTLRILEVVSTPEPAPKEKKLSLLNVAAQILKDSGEAKNTRTLVKEAIEQGLWQPTSCKTPEQTLYGAIHREIKIAREPRFQKSTAVKGAFVYIG